MIKNIFIAAFLLISPYLKAQSFVYYPISSVFGISTNPDKRIWLDLRFQTNSYFSSLGTDIAPEINIVSKPRVKYYMGAGIRINYLNIVENKNALEGYFFNSGVRVSPFEKNKKIQLAFEISPFVSKNAEIGLLKSSIGIGYNFSGIK